MVKADVLSKNRHIVGALKRGQVSGAVVLPRWEGQACLITLRDHVSSIVELEDIEKVVAPNLYGLPRWDFVFYLV